MNTIRTFIVVVISMFLAIPSHAEEVDLVESGICERYAESVVRVGSRLAESMFSGYKAEELNGICDTEIRGAALNLRDSREDFEINGDVVTFYSRNQPEMTVFASQISFVGGIYQVQDLDVYLVEVLVASNSRKSNTRFSVFTDLDRAVAARDEIREVVTSSIDQSVASIIPLMH